MQREPITLISCFNYMLDMFNSDPYGFVSTGEPIDSDKEITASLLDLGKIWNENFFNIQQISFYQHMKNEGCIKLVAHYENTIKKK